MFYPDSYVFMCFEITQVYLRLVASGVCKGHLQNEFSETSKKWQSLQCMHNLNPFYRNSKISHDKPTLGLSSPSIGEWTSPTIAAPTTATIAQPQL